MLLAGQCHGRAQRQPALQTGNERMGSRIHRDQIYGQPCSQQQRLLGITSLVRASR
jgi:hypothetical protein